MPYSKCDILVHYETRTLVAEQALGILFRSPSLYSKPQTDQNTVKSMKPFPLPTQALIKLNNNNNLGYLGSVYGTLHAFDLNGTQ